MHNMPYYAYSRCKCSDTAAEEDNKCACACVQLLSHNTYRISVLKHANVWSQTICTHFSNILHSDRCLFAAVNGMVCGKSQGDCKVLIEMSAIYSKVTSTVSFDLSFLPTYKLIHSLCLSHSVKLQSIVLLFLSPFRGECLTFPAHPLKVLLLNLIYCLYRTQMSNTQIHTHTIIIKVGTLTENSSRVMKGLMPI